MAADHTVLAPNLRKAAKGTRHEARANELADAFETKAVAYYRGDADVSPQSFMGAWARARRLYCELTGEALI